MTIAKRALQFLKNRYVRLFLLLFALIFIRYCCYGFKYYYQLDDYIQYHNYAQSGSPFSLILDLGLLAARPLAGIADIFIWSRFFNVMIFAVAVLSAMYAASALLLQWVWSHKFPAGFMFLAVFTLLPLGFEGTYWISASSRIIPGLFFAALALFFFQRWCLFGKRAILIFCAISQLICFGFYEQALVFSITATIILAALNYSQYKSRALWGLISIINAGLYFLFTSFFSGSTVYGNRLGFITSYDRYYWRVYFPSVAKQVYDAFIKGGFYTFVKGAKRGAEMLVCDRRFFYAVAVLILCTVLYVFIIRTKDSAAQKRSTIGALAAGLLLTVAPLSIFFVINNAWFSLRCTVMSFCGIALISDTLAIRLSTRPKHGKRLMAIAASCFALICCVASVSELRDYRDTTENDEAYIKRLTAQLEFDGRMDSRLKVAVLNTQPSYLKNQNFYHHEHIHGVTESGWALTGALERYAGAKRPSVTPMPKNPVYSPWNIDTSRLDNFDAVYIFLDSELLEVRAEKTSDGIFRLYDNKKLIGRVWEEDNYGYLELY